MAAADPRSSGGFSLIEVVLALGVISFALVAIFGVFPTGLAANRLGISDTRAAQLANAVATMIDSQSTKFSSVDCYGATLNLASLDKSAAPVVLHAGYPSPSQPEITNIATAASIYTIEMRFDNDPEVAPGTKLGAGKLNQIQMRFRGKSADSSTVEFFFTARNKG
ncbi:MAG TPA: prepilin-type N-terminal cleavage/methylation domain-containing protein [Chthoniobacterales bacterium]|nr:prepilin-type N-terminal cleavage/methylation domain-containing protein [Chthoniobacterales bacterium]